MKRKALYALALGGFGIGMTEFVIMGILPVVTKSLSISIPKAGQFISAYALGVVIGAPTLTLLSNRFPKKIVLISLMAWFALFNTLTAFSGSYEVMLATRFFSGLPHGAFFGVGAVVAGRLSDEGKEAQAVAVMFGGLTIANIIGVPLGTYIGQHIDWRITFGLVGLIGLGTMLSLFFRMPAIPNKTGPGLIKQMSLLKRKEPWLVLMITAIGTGGFFAWYSYIAPLLIQVTGFEEHLVIYILVIAGLGMTAGNMIGGKLADRFSPVSATSILLFIMSVSLLLFTFLAGSKIAVLVLTFVLGTVSFSIAAPVQMLMIRASKGAEELGSSFNQAAFNIANALGAYLGGIPISMGYGFLSANWVGAVLALSGALIAGSVMVIQKNTLIGYQRLFIRFKWYLFRRYILLAPTRL